MQREGRGWRRFDESQLELEMSGLTNTAIRPRVVEVIAASMEALVGPVAHTLTFEEVVSWPGQVAMVRIGEQVINRWRCTASHNRTSLYFASSPRVASKKLGITQAAAKQTDKVRSIFTVQTARLGVPPDKLLGSPRTLSAHIYIASAKDDWYFVEDTLWEWWNPNRTIHVPGFYACDGVRGLMALISHMEGMLVGGK